MYELARNPDIQERLRKEVNERAYALRNRGRYNTNVSYDYGPYLMTR